MAWDIDARMICSVRHLHCVSIARSRLDALTQDARWTLGALWVYRSPGGAWRLSCVMVWPYGGYSDRRGQWGVVACLRERGGRRPRVGPLKHCIPLERGGGPGSAHVNFGRAETAWYRLLEKRGKEKNPGEKKPSPLVCLPAGRWDFFIPAHTSPFSSLSLSQTSQSVNVPPASVRTSRARRVLSKWVRKAIQIFHYSPYLCVWTHAGNSCVLNLWISWNNISHLYLSSWSTLLFVIEYWPLRWF